MNIQYPILRHFDVAQCRQAQDRFTHHGLLRTGRRQFIREPGEQGEGIRESGAGMLNLQQ